MKLASKVMTTVLWDTRWIIYIDYLEKEQTITGAYYALLLPWLSEEIKKKRRYLKKEKILFHQRQRTDAHLRSFEGRNYGIKIRNITTSTGFGLQSHFSISKLEKTAQRTTVHVERGHRPKRCIINHSLSKYSWFKSGYFAEKPGKFENLVDCFFKTFSNTL